jgi:hypothetical protein
MDLWFYQILKRFPNLRDCIYVSSDLYDDQLCVDIWWDLALLRYPMRRIIKHS